MWPELTKGRIYIRTGVTDFRKQINGLTLIVQNTMNQNPFTGDLYLFCSTDRRKLKAVYWDKNGFCMWQKRLEKDRFPWPDGEAEANTVTSEELRMILNGIDLS